MKKFKFQLATLLKVSEHKKDQAQIIFAEADTKLLVEEEKMEQVLAAYEQCLQDYYEVTKKSIGIDELKTYAVYFEKLQNDIKNQQEQVRIAVEYKNCCLKKLEEEISKLKTIEQLKEKKIEECKTDLLQTEQKELDEIGLQIFKRNVR